MTAPEFRQHLQRLDITPNMFGRLLAVDTRMTRRWAAGSQNIPSSAALLISRMTPEEAQGLLDMARSVK